MPEDEELNLQDESMWDFDKAETRPASRSNRVVVSVAFARQDFERVAEHAESVNMKTSEFIRAAALDKVSKPAEASTFSCSVSNAGFIITGSGIGTSTQVRSPASRDEPAFTI
jgi:hypothetical protein